MADCRENFSSGQERENWKEVVEWINCAKPQVASLLYFMWLKGSKIPHMNQMEYSLGYSGWKPDK